MAGQVVACVQQDWAAQMRASQAVCFEQWQSLSGRVLEWEH